MRPTVPNLDRDYGGRDTCWSCFRVTRLCICENLPRFEIEPLLVLLVHPREFMKTIGTARMVKLSVTNSIFWRGTGPDADLDPFLQKLISDPGHYPMILFPGTESLNLSTASTEDLQTRLPEGRRLVVFVIDGTWTTAKQMIRKSKVLSSLPKLSFNVENPSTYQFRKQPKPYCLSTVEAVSVLIDAFILQKLCTPPKDHAHRKMLNGFHALVKSQVEVEANLPKYIK
jgi:DTW domain-containing protein YfiP